MLPPFQDQIPTGNTPPSGYRYYQFRIPATDWLVKAVMGQLIALNDPSAFIQNGTVTPDQAAEYLTQVYESVKQVYPIGSIVVYAAGLPATTSILPCNGASYLRTDYPDLFSAIGTVWGAVDMNHFNVPDLRSRSVVGAGQGSGLSLRVAGQTFGEETHQLTVAELASHTHSLQDYLLTGTAVPPPLDAIDAIPHVVNSTGSTGGDQPHNNMQPSGVCTFGIIAL
jgi:microcystin-dependent protein